MENFNLSSDSWIPDLSHIAYSFLKGAECDWTEVLVFLDWSLNIDIKPNIKNNRNLH